MAERIDAGDVSGAKSAATRETRRQRRARAKRVKPRSKHTYDLPARMIEAVREIADREGVSQSDVVALALARFLEAYHAGTVELGKRQSRSVRFTHKLLLPKGWR